MKHSIHCIVTLSCILIAGCAAAPTQRASEPQLPAAGADGRHRVRFPVAKQGEERFIAELGTKVETTCDFEPHFLTNAVEPLPQDAERTRALAACLRLPAVRDRDILLVGRTDARGSEPDNHELGLQRARHVKALLERHGVAADRIHITSAGEWQAKGMSPDYSHGHDRRVDVILVERGRYANGARASR